MQRNMSLLLLICLVLVQGSLTVDSVIENNRKSVEIKNISYLIEPNGQYTWKEAQVECRKKLGNLIEPHAAYDYTELNYYIKDNFENYDSFWTNSQVELKSVFASFGLAKSGGLKCNYFEGTTFKYQPGDCNQRLGFICEKPLEKDVSYFKDKENIFMTQTNKAYTCLEAQTKCVDLHMSLVTYDHFASNTVLQNNITKRYGTTAQFWLDYNDKYGYNCVATHGKEIINLNTNLGFICEKSLREPRFIDRHLVLIIIVCVFAISGLVVLCALTCYFRKVQYHVFDRDIPEPLGKHNEMRI